MNLSPNISSLRPSGTMAYFARVRELIREGRDIVSLATGELHLPTPEHIGRAGIRAIRDGHTKYTLNAGLRELRAAIARTVSETHGVPYTFDQVIVATGSKQALFNALYAVAGRGDEVIVPTPYYPSYPEQIRMSGAMPVFLHTYPDTDFQIELHTLRTRLTDRTRAILINSPNNPTGAIYSDRSLRAVADLARERNLWIITDDIYEAIAYPPATQRYLLRLAPDLADRTIVISGFSKSYSMTGWRIGYAVGPKSIIDAASLIQSHLTNNASSISQHAALAALEEPSDFQRDLIPLLQNRRDYALAALRAIPDITCPAANGAFYLFPDISRILGGKIGDRPMITSSDLALYLLEEHGVAVVPGSAFGAEGHLRISYATEENRLAEALHRFKNGIGATRRK